ncbi:MAG: 4-(cytidine 5'-diphospho)-2-C-methyl-D-erythritol kinase [Actinobacteria bacterium]|nr:4-(cytidine 5'-diphospho)-2-C-methyl-D-erythritol kinase [Actinomycetota bacterium]
MTAGHDRPESRDWAEARAPAKINLFLFAGPRRGDGYHPVFSLMEEVSLYDVLRVRRAKPGSGASLTGMDIPAAENIVIKAARLLSREAGVSLDVEIEIVKRIPVAAGLGGGSSDAAAALKLLAGVSGLNISGRDLARVALAVGADVPFFLTRGPQLASGAGEILEGTGVPEHFLVLVTPDCRLASGKVYGRFDETGGGSDLAAHESRLRHELHKAAGSGGIASLLHNDLEPAAVSLCQEIVTARRELLACGAAGALVSGSGPTVFGIFPDQKSADAAAEKLRLDFPQVWALRPVN